jgi:hypothetical protein
MYSSERDGISIFINKTGQWQEEAWLPADAIHPNGRFTAIAIDGDTLAAGLSPVGVVVYERIDGTWQPAFRYALSARPDDGQLDLEGDQMLVGGAQRADLFERRNGRWQRTQTFAPRDELGQGFGATVALGDGSLVITAPDDSTWGERQPGAVYIYDRAPAVVHQPSCVARNVFQRRASSPKKRRLCELLEHHFQKHG